MATFLQQSLAGKQQMNAGAPHSSVVIPSVERDLEVAVGSSCDELNNKSRVDVGLSR